MSDVDDLVDDVGVEHANESGPEGGDADAGDGDMKKAGLIRKSAIILFAVLAVIVGAVSWLFGDSILRNQLVAALESQNLHPTPASSAPRNSRSAWPSPVPGSVIRFAAGGFPLGKRQSASSRVLNGKVGGSEPGDWGNVLSG